MEHIPSLTHAWRRTFWTSYDHLGLVVILSLLWLVCVFTIFMVPAGTAALFYIGSLMIRNKQVRIKDFFCILRKYFLRSTFLTLTFVIVVIILTFNIRFYLSQFGILGNILAGISFWLLFFVLLMSIYIFPLLSADKRYTKILKYSLFLVLNNLMFSLGFAFFCVILLCLEVLLPIIGIGILAVFSQEAFLEIQARYNQDIKITEPRRSLKELLKPWESS